MQALKDRLIRDLQDTQATVPFPVPSIASLVRDLQSPENSLLSTELLATISGVLHVPVLLLPVEPRGPNPVVFCEGFGDFSKALRPEGMDARDVMFVLHHNSHFQLFFPMTDIQLGCHESVADSLRSGLVADGHASRLHLCSAGGTWESSSQFMGLLMLSCAAHVCMHVRHVAL